MNSTYKILDLVKTNSDEMVRSPEWYRQLVAAVNDLVANNFEALVQILYRLDVSEQKIREALAENRGTDAGELMAKLLLERQIQRLEAKKQFVSPVPENEDEKW